MTNKLLISVLLPSFYPFDVNLLHLKHLKVVLFSLFVLFFFLTFIRHIVIRFGLNSFLYCVSIEMLFHNNVTGN